MKFLLLCFFLAFQFVTAQKVCHVVSPTRESVVVAGQDFEFVITVDDMEKFPEFAAVGFYKSVPAEDNLVYYHRFKKADLKPYDNSGVRYTLPVDNQQLLLTNGRYQYALTTSKWYGRKDLCVSDEYEAIKTGAQPNVPVPMRFIEGIGKPEFNAVYSCSKVPIEVDFLKEFAHDMVIRVKSLSGDEDHSGHSEKILKLNVKDLQGKQAISTTVSVPKNMVGPFVLEFFIDKVRDKLMYRSGVFNCVDEPEDQEKKGGKRKREE